MGVQDYRLLLRRTREGVDDARVKFYKDYLMWQWPLTIGLLSWWLWSGYSLESIGLIPVADGRQWVAVGVGVIVLLTQVIYLAIAPRTPKEDRLFGIVSITAGVCEEILYRGLLLAALVSLVGTWPAVAISSLIFGLGHAYQGTSGIAMTGLVGLVLALLTVVSGSLYTAIILHAVIDLTSGRVMGKALRVTTLQAA